MEDIFNYLLQNPSMLAWSTLRIDADGVYYIDGILWNELGIPDLECELFEAVDRKVHEITGLTKIMFTYGDDSWYLYWNEVNNKYD